MKKVRTILLLAILIIFIFNITVYGANSTVFDQSDLITSEMSPGIYRSALQGERTTYGHNINNNSKYLIADDFTLSKTTLLKEITFYAYQTGSSTTSTFTNAYVVIYDGDPREATTNIVWGDTINNRLKQSSFTNIYRVNEEDSNATDRPIMGITANIDTLLSAGTYWVGVSATGSLGSGPWGVMRTTTDGTDLGNGIQRIDSGTNWRTWEDDVTGEQLGMAFKLLGEYDFNITAGEVKRISKNEATIKFTSEKAGEYFYSITDVDSLEPTIDTTGTGSICDTEEQTIVLSNLTAGAKSIYIKAKDEKNLGSKLLKIDIPGEQYSIDTITYVGEHGTILASKQNATTGEKITITVSPEEGYKVKSFVLTDESGEKKITLDSNNTFELLDYNIFARAEFEIESLEKDDTPKTGITTNFNNIFSISLLLVLILGMYVKK